jgi:DNA-binding NtrC family response regulator
MTSSDDDFPAELETVAVTRVQRPGERPVFEFTRPQAPVGAAPLVLDDATPGRVLVGSGPACALRLDAREISRRHLALEWADGQVRLTDLGSTNGTFVNGVRVGEAFLAGGEIVRIGDVELLVRRRFATNAARPAPLTAFGRFLGASPELQRLYPLCDRLAKSDIPVLIEGETGTGKELLAEAIHEASARASGPFVVFDCTAVPPNLVESTLFGHERGAFTGAVASRKGLFEEAQGGTLLIDEIGDLDPALQPKLLRALERSEIRRVGGDRPISVDLRVLAATRRDLDREVQAGRFRDDLFFRIAVTRIELPPLRRRAGDIAVLARHFWRAFGGGDEGPPAALLSRFDAYAWPGNVRELRNAVSRCIALGDLAESPWAGGPAAVASSEAATGGAGAAAPGPNPTWVDEILAADLPFTRARERVLEVFGGLYVARALERHGGNVSRAAAAAGLARRYFQILKARQKKD